MKHFPWEPKLSTLSPVVCNAQVLRPHGNKAAKHGAKVAIDKELSMIANTCATINFYKCHYLQDGDASTTNIVCFV